MLRSLFILQVVFVGVVGWMSHSAHSQATADQCTCRADEKQKDGHGSNVANAKLCVLSVMGPRRWCEITVEELDRPGEARGITKKVTELSVNPATLGNRTREQVTALNNVFVALVKHHQAQSTFAKGRENDAKLIEQVNYTNGGKLLSCLFEFKQFGKTFYMDKGFICSALEPGAWLSILYNDLEGSPFAYSIRMAPLR